MAKSTNKYISPEGSEETNRFMICHPSFQSSILRFNFGAQESLSDLISYSLLSPRSVPSF